MVQLDSACMYNLNFTGIEMKLYVTFGYYTHFFDDIFIFIYWLYKDNFSIATEHYVSLAETSECWTLEF